MLVDDLPVGVAFSSTSGYSFSNGFRGIRNLMQHRNSGSWDIIGLLILLLGFLDLLEDLPTS